MQFQRSIDCNQETPNAPSPRQFQSRRTAIVLCVLNGADYLIPQLQSLYRQTDSDFALYISDDGSTDRSPELTAEHTDPHTTRFFQGLQKGFCHHFLHTLARTETTHQYYAFCDQDDVWHQDKLERAIAQLKTVPKHIPALYCSRTEIIDAEGNRIGESPLFAHPPSFANALVQNIGGGNTMVMNRAARDLVISTAVTGIISHDWWAYLVVAGAGGAVVYDPRPSLGYRQHGHNAIGANQNWKARAQRARALLKGRFRDWNSAHLAALERSRHLLTEEAQRQLQAFDATRTASSWRKRLFCLRISGLYRQTPLGNLGLIIAAALGKL